MQDHSVAAHPVISTARVRHVELSWPASRLSAMVAVAVVALTLLAGTIRVANLAVPDGSLGKDEAKLALAADGVLKTGLPILPSGRVYTRGLVNSYLIAPAFAWFGRHDFSARLPSVLAGALLVPVVFLLGRPLAGVAAGLAAAAFVALAGPLIAWSRNAWLPSVSLLLFTLSVYCGYRGFVERRGNWQIATAVCLWLALLSYELTVVMLVGLALYLALRAARGDWGWYVGPPSLVALALLAVALALFGALALTLRTGTLAGPLGEVNTFLAPGLSFRGIVHYFNNLLSGYWVLLLAAALLTLPPLARQRLPGTLYLGTLLALSLLVPSFLIQSKYSERYALHAVPLLAVLGALATTNLVDLGTRRIGSAPFRSFLVSLVLIVVFCVALVRDSAAVFGVFQQTRSSSTWIEILEREGLQTSDLILAEVPDIVHFYLGRADFYVDDPDDFERHAYRTPNGLRHLYTASLLIQKRSDFERLVERPNHGRVLWLVGRDRLLGLGHMVQAVDRSLWQSLVRSADRVIDTGDGWLLVRVTLPRRQVSS